jgi:5-methyltetrahydrofolate--homocysteine methyltransferase
VLIVGEKINTSRAEVAEAVGRRDAGFIRKLARRQSEAGAHYIDVNCGTFADNEPELLCWMVDEIQRELGDVPLCIDSSAPDAVRAALGVCRGETLLNSISGEKDVFASMAPIIKKFGCGAVILPIDDKSGIASDAATRFATASNVIDTLAGMGVPPQRLYIDQLIQPISVDSKNGLVAADTVRRVREKYPLTHAICGLSNISYSMPERKLLNQTYLVICAAYGLDAVILDPEDRQMMRMVYASDALLDHDVYCKAYLGKYRDGFLK